MENSTEERYKQDVIDSDLKDINQFDSLQPRFQRTGQWLPVYTWLESLDTCEIVKSRDITDWLAENPHVKEQLYSRHSRYHMMHYIRKLHFKILKRQGKLKSSRSSEPIACVKASDTEKIHLFLH